MSTKKHDQTLLGKWKVIGCQLNGVWLPAPIFEHFIYSFPDTNNFRLDWSELTFPQYVGGFPKSESGKIKIKKGSNQIDLIPSSGPFQGKTFKGIYELDHDILKANFGLPGKDRPCRFSAGQGQVYEIWQRL